MIWTEAKRERARQLSREHYWRDPKANIAKNAAWKAANPGKVRAINKRRTEKLSAQRALLRESGRAEREARKAASQEKQREFARERGRQRYASMTAEERARVLAQGKTWRANNKERNRALIRAWKKAHPETKRDSKSNARRRAWLMEVQNGRCGYCRTKLDKTCHIDHVMPLALGGSNRRSNLQLLCAPCNLAKSAKHPVEFAQSIGRLI